MRQPLPHRHKSFNSCKSFAVSQPDDMSLLWADPSDSGNIELSSDRLAATRLASARGPAVVMSSTVLQPGEIASIVIDASRDSDSLFVGCVVAAKGDTDPFEDVPGVALHLYDGRLCTFDSVTQPMFAQHAAASFQARAGKAGDVISIKTRRSWSDKDPPGTRYASFRVSGNVWKEAKSPLQGDVRLFARIGCVDDRIRLTSEHVQTNLKLKPVSFTDAMAASSPPSAKAPLKQAVTSRFEAHIDGEKVHAEPPPSARRQSQPRQLPAQTAQPATLDTPSPGKKAATTSTSTSHQVAPQFPSSSPGAVDAAEAGDATTTFELPAPSSSAPSSSAPSASTVDPETLLLLQSLRQQLRDAANVNDELRIAMSEQELLLRQQDARLQSLAEEKAAREERVASLMQEKAVLEDALRSHASASSAVSAGNPMQRSSAAGRDAAQARHKPRRRSLLWACLLGNKGARGGRMSVDPLASASSTTAASSDGSAAQPPMQSL